MCFSFPLLLLKAESTLDDEEPDQTSPTGCSSEEAESTLDDNAGMSFWVGRRLGTWIAGVTENCGWGSQQNVSLFQIRQIVFCNLFPSSIDSAHLEKTVHIPNRLSTFRGSTLCILPASTVRTGAAKREGIVSKAVRSGVSTIRCFQSTETEDRPVQVPVQHLCWEIERMVQIVSRKTGTINSAALVELSPDDFGRASFDYSILRRGD